nr:unnamed protein product [Callosobruchus analis]
MQEKGCTQGGSRRSRFTSKFLCRTQAIEGCVIIVTESAAACGPERREGSIKARLHSHKFMPTFNRKKEYRLL